MEGSEKVRQERGLERLIEVSDLTKTFGPVTAVDGIAFHVLRGEIFGFLGPNGAGKTTTINMLTGLARPDAGTIRIAGLDCSNNPKAAQHLTGVVPDESNLYPELTGFDNLSFCGALYGMGRSEREARARQLLEAFDLAGVGDRSYAGYSKGMKRKLTIAAGIIHQPQILFLDEPTTGIDVPSARQIRGLIAELCRSGATVFLTTHYIEEAERLCDRIAFIVNGRIVRVDSVANLLLPIQGRAVMMISVLNSSSDLSDELAAAFPQFEFQAVSASQVRVESGGQIGIGPLVRFIEERGSEVSEARRMRPSLEEVFIRVTGIELNDMLKEKGRMGGGR